PLSVTTNLVRAEAFVNDPIWFRLSQRAEEAFGSRSYCRQLFRASGTGQSLRTAPSLVRKTTVGPHATFRGRLFGARRSYGGPRRRKWEGIIQIGDARGVGILSGLGGDHQRVVALDLQLAAVEHRVVAEVG